MKKNLLFLIAIFAIFAQVSFAQLTLDSTKAIFFLPFDSNYVNVVPGSGVTLDYDFTRTTEEIGYDKGKFGAAGLFSNSLLMTNGIVFDQAANFSMATWVKVTTETAPQTFVHQATVEGAPAGRIFLEYYSAATMVFGSFTHGTHDDATTTPELDTWYHFALVNNMDDGLTDIYLNGVLETTVTEANPEAHPGELAIGARRPDHAAIGAVDFGSMDDFLLTTELLDETKIAAIMDKGVSMSMYGRSLTGNNGSGTTAIKNNTVNSSISCFYNNGTLRIKSLNNLTDGTYQIVNLSGQVVMNGILAGNNVNVELPAGIYVLSVNNSNTKFIVR